MNPGQPFTPNPMNQGVNQMLELFKMQYLMKFLDTSGTAKGSNQGSLLTMLVLMGYDQVIKYVPLLLQALWVWLLFKWNGGKFANDKKDPLPLANLPQPPAQKSIRAFIQFERRPDKAADPQIDAVVSHVCSIPEVTSLRYNGVEMIPNFKNALMIDNDVWFEIVSSSNGASSSGMFSFSGSSTSSSSASVEPILYRLSTYDHDITWLHRFVQNTMERFEQEKKNKLGSEMYYFDQITAGNDAFRSYANRGSPIFTKSRFLSNRTLSNVYLRQIDELKQRVDFFMKRRDWYDSKGIPHTLGIVMYGVPGCGKTSTIKGIANETKRHIFNIALSEIKTKEALKDLFYSEQVYVLQDGKAEVLNIPLKQRLYVIEDIDAMDSVVIKRSAEQKRKEEQQRLRVQAEMELLKQTQGEVAARSMIQGKQSEDRDKLDLATLLNVLDGVRETPGRIIILSTNYPERLDEALLRPGRFDMMLEFEKHNPEVLRQHLEKHYDTQLTPQQWSRINQPLLEKKWTPAEVSQILFRRLGSIDAAIQDLVEEDPAKVFKFSQMGLDGSQNQMQTESMAEESKGTDLTALFEITESKSENIIISSVLRKDIPRMDNFEQCREDNNYAIQAIQNSHPPLSDDEEEKPKEDLVEKIKEDMNVVKEHWSDYTGYDSPEPGIVFKPRRKLTPEEKKERREQRERRNREWEERDKRIKKEQKENTIETVLASSMFQNFLETATDSAKEFQEDQRDVYFKKYLEKEYQAQRESQKAEIQKTEQEMLTSSMFRDLEGLAAANDDTICDASCLDEYYAEIESNL